MIKIYNVLTRKIYEKDGEKKTRWYKAGIMKETEKGSKYLRLFHQPEIDFFIFEKEQEQQTETPPEEK